MLSAHNECMGKPYRHFNWRCLEKHAFEMSVYKDGKTGKWRVIYRFTDYTGERRQTQKRGFETRREAVAWEHEQILKTQASLDMTFGSFCDQYISDVKPRLKQNTWNTKEHILRTKILPYFKNRKIAEIKSRDVVAWQNTMLEELDSKGRKYSQTYLKTVHNQLSAIFNHAMRFYGLKENPARQAGNMGKEERKEMLFWTQEEYRKFADVMMDKPLSFYAFEMLYWCGIREGELLALTPADFDFKAGTVTINKSYQRIKGKDVITDPKTPKSNRTIQMPQFLIESITLSLLGGLIGVAFGMLIAFAGAKALKSNFTISPGAILLGVGFSAVVGIIFGWAPARRASRLNPIDALRSE